MSDESFICGTCAREHPGLPTDYAFGLPDEVYSLAYLDRYRRSRSNADLCTLDDERFFVRGVLPIPFVGSHEEFVWGLWVEVTKDQHDLYLAGYYDDLSDNPRFTARLANQIPGYDETLDLVVDVQFRSGNDRPTFYLSEAISNVLAREQRGGITRERHHEILQGMGFFRNAS
ncbi:MAG TPA: DUF2199 domain-containing protein [Thermoanaerobaculia bacterium]|jgi:hypothetical protein|nr:DUF2199 domain-containing protein [Thermoanaerobaculia bacterium]